MKVRAPQDVVRSSESKSTAAAAAAVVQSKATAPASSFGPAARASDLARAERPARHVALPSLAQPGPVGLKSSEGQQLLAQSLAAVGGDASTFSAKSIERDELGMVHIRLDRVQDGVKVFGQQAIVHFDKAGKLAGIDGNAGALSLAQGDAQRLAGVTAGAATTTAVDAFAKEFGLAPQVKPTAEQVFYKGADGQFRRAIRVEVSNFKDGDRPLRMNYMVDAESGAVLRKFNAIGGFVDARPSGQSGRQANAVSGSGAQATGPANATDAKGHTLYSGQVKIVTHKNKDGSYSLKDDKRGGGATWDAKNQDPAGGKAVFKDQNNVWGEKGDPKRQQGAVDAHYGMERTWDFYKGVLGRDSIDGKGEALNSYVHVGSKYVNAYWDGEKMNYGDGDGKDASILTSLDVAGHEITHGLTERTAGLIYDGESGGLNEAMSDIMGTGVEWYAAKRNASVKWDYKIGEDLWTPGKPGDALRYMNDPKKDGYSIDNYKDYPKQTEVHGSSGIANNAFYLLTHGGKNRTSGIEVQGGIGMEKGLKIFGRALTAYMTPDTTFAQAKQACLKAATDLYGADSVEVQKVKESWTAVGVK